MFKIFEEQDDDQETRDLDAKVEQTLKDIAQTSTSVPEAFGQWLTQALLNLQQKGNKSEDVQPLIDQLQQTWKLLPDVTSVMNNWTGTLSAYAQHRALIKQERIANKILKENQNLTRATLVLAGTTAVLAIATIVLAIR